MERKKECSNVIAFYNGDGGWWFSLTNLNDVLSSSDELWFWLAIVDGGSE